VGRQRSTDDWFNDFLDLLKELDSGIDLQDADFNNDEKGIIKAIESFVDDEFKNDNVGRGTFIAGIILRLTANVDLYIAKITNVDRPSKTATVKVGRFLVAWKQST